MNLQEAFKIMNLDFSECSNISLKDVKRKYHKLALKYHPDKNGNTVESTDMFKKINEAYEVIVNELGELEDLPKVNDISYESLLKVFISQLTSGQYNDFITNILKNIVEGCAKISLDHLNQEQAVSVYYFLLKNKTILHISDETIENVKSLLLEKFKDIQIFILIPSLNDLINNQIYKLEINKTLYYVPLWHTELYFDSDIIVKCNPNLPTNVEIDEDNNLIVTEMRDIRSLIGEEWLSFELGDVKFNIPVKQLYIRSFQVYRFKKQGILRINEHNIYDEENRADVIVRLYLE
jgi:hypothetical protein